MESNGLSKKVKILIMGLDGSGKTSICLSLQKSTNLLDFYQLKPTKGVNVQNITCNAGEVSVWDFGGQERYRVEYLKNFSKFTGNITQIIYVIDVQNIPRYADSLKYLKEIIQKLKEEDNLVAFSIYLHKFDPSLPFKKGFETIDEILKQQLLSKFKEIIPKEINYEVYKTSIYTTFERNLLIQD